MYSSVPYWLGTATLTVRSGRAARVTSRARTERTRCGPMFTGGVAVSDVIADRLGAHLGLLVSSNGKVTRFGFVGPTRDESTVNAKERSTAYSATISLVCGITEPLEASTYERMRSYLF